MSIFASKLIYFFLLVQDLLDVLHGFEVGLWIQVQPTGWNQLTEVVQDDYRCSIVHSDSAHPVAIYCCTVSSTQHWAMGLPIDNYSCLNEPYQ